MQFFPNGFVVLNGKAQSMTDLDQSLRAGSMFSIRAEYGASARFIQ
jgi:hypothetical protein